MNLARFRETQSPRREKLKHAQLVLAAKENKVKPDGMDAFLSRVEHLHDIVIMLMSQLLTDEKCDYHYVTAIRGRFTPIQFLKSLSHTSLHHLHQSIARQLKSFNFWQNKH